MKSRTTEVEFLDKRAAWSFTFRALRSKALRQNTEINIDLPPKITYPRLSISPPAAKVTNLDSSPQAVI